MVAGTLDAAATAALDQIAARAGIDAESAGELIRLGAEQMLNAVITALEVDCRATCDGTLRGERRIGGHLMVGEMVGRLKILRRMTTEGAGDDGR